MTWREARTRQQHRMRISMRLAASKGLVPPKKDAQRLPPKTVPIGVQRKKKDNKHRKNYKHRFSRLKICARLAAWLDSFILEVKRLKEEGRVP
eukprot:141076-Karenia_brevis.AAC.1